MVRIGELGCSFSELIVMKGNNVNSIWYLNGDNCYIYKESNSLKEYLTTGICNKK